MKLRKKKSADMAKTWKLDDASCKTNKNKLYTLTEIEVFHPNDLDLERNAFSVYTCPNVIKKCICSLAFLFHEHLFTFPDTIPSKMVFTNDSTPSPPTSAPLADEFDMATAEKMHFITSSYFGTIFVIIGLVGNVLSILVWKRKKMRSSTGTYLIGQAIADAGLLIFFFITDSIPMMAPSVKTSSAFGGFFAFIGYPIFFLLVVCSIWFTVGVTVDRYIQVCWISQAKVNVRQTCHANTTTFSYKET